MLIVLSSFLPLTRFIIVYSIGVRWSSYLEGLQSPNKFWLYGFVDGCHTPFHYLMLSVIITKSVLAHRDIGSIPVPLRLTICIEPPTPVPYKGLTNKLYKEHGTKTSFKPFCQEKYGEGETLTRSPLKPPCKVPSRENRGSRVVTHKPHSLPFNKSDSFPLCHTITKLS